MDDRAQVAKRFVSLLRSAGSGKLRDGHWPISAWQAVPGVRAALRLLVDVARSSPAPPRFALPWGPTAFLNLYYYAALALHDAPPESPAFELANSFLDGFACGRGDLLANEGSINFRAMNPGLVTEFAAGPWHTDSTHQVFDLCALMAASAESRGWLLHRFYNEVHGPYPTETAGLIFVQSFNLDSILSNPDELSAKRYQHLCFRLHDGLNLDSAGLDFWGHLGRDLGSLVQSVAVIETTEAGVTRLPASRIQDMSMRLEAEIVSHAAQVNTMTAERLCSGVGRRFLEVCLAAMDHPVSQRHEILSQLPEQIQPNPAWSGTREEFLRPIENLATLA
ncbi:hypothetical protein [Actinoplanes sp. GCM10030250]|uniref:hypothetical protein n=1 Tax=Actinoplanes sp. GCM10030250 TaxID=3273376 RepID=UPI00361FB4E0